MKKISVVFGLLLIGTSCTTRIWAAGSASSGGLSLISDGDAQAAALGNAFTGIQNNIAGLVYNPAVSSTLDSGQASFLFQRGLIEDSYGQLMLGVPLHGGGSGLGVSVGYYNAGSINLADETGAIKSVNAQVDETAALSYSLKMNGNLSIGAAAKVLHSTLANQYTANAFAGDLGLLAKMSSRLSVGVSALNFGSEMKYINEGDKLASSVNAGATYLLIPNKSFSTSLLINASYMTNEKNLAPGAGLETLVGPLAIRLGYRKLGDSGQFSAGAGFVLGRTSIDYAFGLIQNMDIQNKISVAMHFGPSATAMPTTIARPIEEHSGNLQIAQEKPAKKENTEEIAMVIPVERTVTEMPVRAHSLGGDTVLRAPRQHRRVYVVQEGDTLASIAEQELGDKRQWKTIYSANKHLIDDPAAIEVGMRIVIPTQADNQ